MARTILAVLVAATLGACAQAPPEQQIINDAASALGGRARVQAVKTLVIEGSGINGNLGQDMTPDATGQAFTLTGYKRAIDVAAGRARIEQTRTPNFTYFQGQQAQKQVLGVDGSMGYNIAVNGTATRVANAVATDRRAEIYHHPLTIVRAALDPAATLSQPRTHDSERIVDVATANGLKFTLAIDSATKLPTRVVSMTDNANLGDVAIETSFADYQDVSGLKLPTHLTTKTDRYTTVDIKVTKQIVDGDAGDDSDLRAPAAAALAAPIAGPPPATVTTEEIAKGVWFLAGQSHHSVLVEFADHLTLIEAPQNDTRARAVIAKARELRPNKPLTQVINTHHHFDHSGGIRAAVSEGLTVITQKANAAFYQDAISRSHSIVPDALAKSPKPLKIETIDEEMVLKDRAMTVNLYRVAGSAHADTLLMAYFPKERLLVEADVFSPAAAVQPYAANLLENIKKHDLKIDRIVPIHGAIVPYSEFLKAVPTAQRVDHASRNRFSVQTFSWTGAGLRFPVGSGMSIGVSRRYRSYV
ncbi:MAG: MBL fold metallo-hydrolase [Acidobacteria bacterium]|nr:MBL fold metallo-hydrolase [Acidobacteriota bacterium]